MHKMTRLKRKTRKRRIDPDRVEPAFVAREEGATLREAAKAAGVHVATLCRWQNREKWIGDALRDAETYARRKHYANLPRRRPPVPWRRDCPQCRAEVEVRTANSPAGFRFWRCSRWPLCQFASWRPPAPLDCHCGGAMLWSHSRKTVVCLRCGQRALVRWKSKCE
jgi:ssDNA-binding Zn-finger/Zn-ribbon topoisomerase 1